MVWADQGQGSAPFACFGLDFPHRRTCCRHPDVFLALCYTRALVGAICIHMIDPHRYPPKSEGIARPGGRVAVYMHCSELARAALETRPAPGTSQISTKDADRTSCGIEKVMVLRDLRLVPEFAQSSAALLKHLQTLLEPRLYLPDQVVLRHGEDMDHMFILQRGACKMAVFETQMDPIEGPCIIGGVIWVCVGASSGGCADGHRQGRRENGEDGSEIGRGGCPKI